MLPELAVLAPSLKNDCFFAKRSHLIEIYVRWDRDGALKESPKTQENNTHTSDARSGEDQTILSRKRKSVLPPVHPPQQRFKLDLMNWATFTILSVWGMITHFTTMTELLEKHQCTEMNVEAELIAQSFHLADPEHSVAVNKGRPKQLNVASKGS